MMPKILPGPLLGKKQRLVTDEAVEFQKSLVEVRNFRRITDHLRGLYRIYLK